MKTSPNYYHKKKLNLIKLIDFELYLGGIEKFKLGGTCYSNNYFLNLLLTWLGYDVILCGADMKTPDVHLVSIVNIEGNRYLIDSGYAAPFSIPIPLDGNKNFTITSGGNRYVLKPRDNYNRSKLELHRSGNHIHGYNINPAAREIEEFEKVIEDSFKEDATFMNTLLIARLIKDTFCIVHNLTYSESRDNLTKMYSLESGDNLVSFIENRFGISKLITKEILSEFKMSGNAWK